MEVGYVQDKSRNLCFQTQWLSGVPEEYVVWGIKCGIKGRQDGISMLAYRCPTCGTVELNAPKVETPAAAAGGTATGKT
jgi:hypothetical protein